MKPWIVAIAFLAGAALHAQQPAAGEERPYSVVEPKAPPKAKPALKRRAGKAKAAAMAKAKAKSGAEKMAAVERPKPNGPCVIKPVMSDQDLVNCGATPRH